MTLGRPKPGGLGRNMPLWFNEAGTGSLVSSATMARAKLFRLQKGTNSMVSWSPRLCGRKTFVACGLHPNLPQTLLTLPDTLLTLIILTSIPTPPLNLIP